MNTVYKNQLDAGRIHDAGDFPKVLLIDTISCCNLKCVMCAHKEMTRKKGIMSWELYTKIIDEIAAQDKNVRVWLVFFGEALILDRYHPTIFDRIAYAKAQGLTDVVLNSNGCLMTEAVAQQLIASGLDAIYIGIDSFSDETYSQIRVGGTYAVTVQNVLNLLRLKKEAQSQCPRVFVQFVEMDANAHEKQAFIDFWSQHDVAVKIRPKVSWAGKIDAPNLSEALERWPCYWAMQTMSITDSGDVVTCAVDVDAGFVAGNIQTQSLSEVWRGKLKEMRLMHLENRYHELPSPCRDCKDWQSARADYYEPTISKN